MIEDTALPAELETLMDVIRRRRSIHQDQLSPEPIPMEYIQWMLEAANYAPTHGLTEPWRFTVFSGEARRALGEAFAQSYRLAFTGEAFQESAWIAQKERVWKAPVWISIGVRIGTHPKIPEWEEIAAVACAVQNAHLVAASLGLGAFWTSGLPVRHENTARFVGLEPPDKLLGFLCVGRPAIPWPKARRKPWEEKVVWRE